MKDRKKQRTSLLEDQILQVLTESKGKILNHKQIFSKIDLPDKPSTAEGILPVLINLAESGKIEQRDQYKFLKFSPRVKVEGIIDITRGGRIFLKVEGQEEDLVVEHTAINLLPF